MCVEFENCLYIGVFGGKIVIYSYFFGGKDDLGEKVLYNIGIYVILCKWLKINGY